MRKEFPQNSCRIPVKNYPDLPQSSISIMEDLQAIEEALPDVDDDVAELESEAQSVAPDLFNDDLYGAARIQVLRKNGITVYEIRRIFGDPATFRKCMCCPRHCRDRKLF